MIYFNENVDEKQKQLFDELFAYALAIEGEDYDKLTVNLSFVSDEEIKSVNSEFRNIDKVTDVLSFPFIEREEGKKINNINYPYDVDLTSGELCLGDILICKQVALSQAEEYGHSYDREICYLFVHAIFHLLGYDHMVEEDKVVMREREEKVLSKFNIKKEEE